MKITKSSEQKARENSYKFCPECEKEFDSGVHIRKPKKLFFYVAKNNYTCECGCEWEVEEEQKVSTDIVALIVSIIITAICVYYFIYSLETQNVFIGLSAFFIGLISGGMTLMLGSGLVFEELDCNLRKEIQK